MKFKVDPLALKVGLGLFVIALLIRLVGIDWGLPNQNQHHSLHPDEEIVWLYSQQVEPAKFDFTPGFYNYGTFYLTVNRIATDMVGAYGGGPQEEDGSDFPEALGHYIRAGRNISALAGAGLAWVGFLLLFRRTHIFGAVMAGASLALAPALVVHSRFMTVDMLATFFAALSIYWATRLIPYEGDTDPIPVTKYAALAGVFAGLSAGTKYTGILTLAVVCVVAFMAIKDRTEAIKSAGLAIGAGLVVFFLTTPGMLLESELFMEHFRYELQHTSAGHGLVFAGTGPGWTVQLANLLTGFGIFTALMGLIGLGWGSTKKLAYLIGPVVFFLLIYILIGKAEIKFIRYTFPMLPVLAMGFGWLMGEAHSGGSKWGRAAVAFGIVALGGMGGGAVSVLSLSGWMAGEDPRVTMANYIEENEIESVGLVSDPWYYSPVLYPEINGGPYLGPQYRFEAMMAAQEPQVLRYLPPNPDERFDFDTRLLTELEPETVVISSFEIEGLERLANMQNVPEAYQLQTQRYKDFIDLLKVDYEVTTVAGGVSGTAHTYQKVHDLMYIRPTLYLWQRKTDSETTSTGTSTTSEPSEEPVETPSPATNETL